MRDHLATNVIITQDRSIRSVLCRCVGILNFVLHKTEVNSKLWLYSAYNLCMLLPTVFFERAEAYLKTL